MRVDSIIFLIILITAFGFLFYNLRRFFLYLKLAQPEIRWDRPLERINKTLKVAIGQSKIFRDKIAGPIHAAIFWGFLVLLFSASESIIQGFDRTFTWSFLGPFFTAITISTDIFCVLIMFAVIWALLRRFVFKVKRLQGDGKEKTDAVIVLVTIFIIVSSLLFQNAAIEKFHFHGGITSLRPISHYISSFFSFSSAIDIYNVSWWVHIIFILSFMNYLPYSKHFHVYTSVLNVFFAPLEPANKLKPIDFEKEGIEKFGVVDVEDFTWKTIFDSYTCTHCGRCDSVCPANLTGKVLSPRNVIIEVRERTTGRMPILLKQKNNNNPSLEAKDEEILNKKFIGEYENIEALWQCTTCGACMQECPVMIEHVPAIVDMRRSLVMMEANFPNLLQTAFTNLENNATPWAFPASERADWAQGTGVQTAAEKPDFEYLFWVGCAGSFDDRAKQISLAFAKLMQIANVDFAILGTEEQCNGDVARRTGQEYLADMLVKANIETMKRYNVRKIVTFCPHCYNTLKNEYPLFGGNFEVKHHTEFLKELIAQGKLKLKPLENVESSIVYHDSCYIGRYNNIYEEPREILSSVSNKPIKEPKRSKDKGLCCGAGGGQMFMEETQGKRVNIERTEELLSTNPNTIAVNCPFCMTMITDGVKAKEKIDEVKVKDIAEILLEKVQTNS